MADSSCRQAERDWRRERNDATALRFMRELGREGDLLLQLMQRVASIQLNRNATWDDTAAWWVGVQPREASLRDRDQGGLLAPFMPAPPAPLFALPINRGYSRAWLSASCRCGHFRGHHEGQPEMRTTCMNCACRVYHHETFPACQVQGCRESVEAGYPACRRHVPGLFPAA